MEIPESAPHEITAKILQAILRIARRLGANPSVFAHTTLKEGKKDSKTMIESVYDLAGYV
jgi:hypothetical protein